SDEWIATRTGIRQRHVAGEGETTGDLAERAARAAMEAAGVQASDLDMIVLGTTTPDLIFPSTACLLQHRLGANGCAAMDVNAACSGFIYALSVADAFIRSGSARTVLVDRKSTRLNSSHVKISYAGLCSKKKTHADAAPQRAS